MLFEETLVIKPHHVVILDVMPEVLGADVLHRAVAGSADPSQPTGELVVMPIHRENGVMGALVDHVSRNDHAVAQQQNAGNKTCPAAGK